MNQLVIMKDERTHLELPEMAWNLIEWLEVQILSQVILA